jgi:hypothetical protein
MPDRVSTRRADTNKFYISFLTALLIVLSIIVEKQLFPTLQNMILLTVGLLGLILCYVWVINLRPYRQLNSGKFKVIHEMEQQLPFPCYTREWAILAKGGDSKKYARLSRIEQLVPFLLALPYLFLLLYAIFLLIP